MKNIKEPHDVDLVIALSVATERDFVVISATIAAYKAAKNKKQFIKNLKKGKAVLAS